ncbi:MAG TPA: DUF4169 family protein [Acetobacteraceae bacterium]|jgi:hypothetical protein|nr:DUF4169 family protein [Acetobacteraceae bacterium]
MAEIVNLRRSRKLRVRAEAAATAQQQRLLHGRTKAEKRLQELEKFRAEQATRNARLEPDDAE